MKINFKNWNLWNGITFKTLSYRKNFDFICDNENIITECEGTISGVRLKENKPPILVGDYMLSIWNIELSRQFGGDFMELMNQYDMEDTYSELLRLITDNHINIDDCKKLIIVNNLVLKPEYRKRGVSEEFIEFLFREYYHEDNKIIALVKPIQDNFIDYDYYFNHKLIDILNTLRKSDGYTTITGKEYYSIDELNTHTDRETNEYKLYSLASKLGFNRLNDSHMFIYSPENTIKRMVEKKKFEKKINV